jgi:hypothetical protein
MVKGARRQRSARYAQPHLRRILCFLTVDQLERRHEDRKMNAIRYAFEEGRSNRLHKLTAVLDRYKTLSKLEQEKLATAFVADMDDSGAHMAYPISKHQQKLTQEEGQLWDGLRGEGPSSEEAAQSILLSLAEKSRLMAESFRRRMNPPTEQTYEECTIILRAMGVPCMKVEGDFEAEALAAALVLNGHADYVASEDTASLIIIIL